MALTKDDRAWLERHQQLASEVPMSPPRPSGRRGWRRAQTSVTLLLASWLLLPVSHLLAYVAVLLSGLYAALFAIDTWRSR
jgi:hypothetical protein